MGVVLCGSFGAWFYGEDGKGGDGGHGCYVRLL